MIVRCLLAIAAVCVLSPVARGANTYDDKDKVFKVGKQTVNGVVSEMTATEITLRQGAVVNKMAVNEIDYITFEDEPQALAAARRFFRGGRYAEALAQLKKVKTDEIKRRETKVDIQYYTAASAARLALGGGGNPKEAGTQLMQFAKANQDNYHFLAACETLGDVLVMFGKYTVADTYYAKVAEAPWPEYQMRAGVLLGRSLLAQRKFDDAMNKFDEVIATTGGAAQGETQRSLAMLGNANCLVLRGGETDLALKDVREIIDKADEKDDRNDELFARAYNVMGAAHLAAGHDKEALRAFLHVDLLFSGFPEQHAEALARLVDLWAKARRVTRSNEVKEQLVSQYPNSPWAAPFVNKGASKPDDTKKTTTIRTAKPVKPTTAAKTDK